MYIVVTRAFPPEVGGMQNLMWGLTNALSKHYMIKVFADYHVQHQNYDKSVSFSIQRVGGIKLLRKYRKAYLVNEFIKKNKNIKGELVVLIEKKEKKEIIMDKNKIISMLNKKIPKLGVSAASKEISKKTLLKRDNIYKLALEIKNVNKKND